MSKYNLFKAPYTYFHFSFECNPSGWFKELDWIRQCRTINGLALTHGIECIAFVMMDTHSHMLLRSRHQQENFFAEHVLRELAANRLEPEYLEPIKNISQFLNAYRYIYRNPVEAGLALRCEEYAYSTLPSLLGRTPQRLLVWDGMNVIQNPLSVLRWLNSANSEFRPRTW